MPIEGVIIPFVSAVTLWRWLGPSWLGNDVAGADGIGDQCRFNCSTGRRNRPDAHHGCCHSEAAAFDLCACRSCIRSGQVDLMYSRIASISCSARTEPKPGMPDVKDTPISLRTA